MYGSATEQLARRYRHLFVLPSFPAVSALLAISTLFFLAPMVAINRLPLAGAAVVFGAAFLASGATNLAIRALDPDSIASLRRTIGLSFATNLLWAAPVALGTIYFEATHMIAQFQDEVVLGAFLAWSLELLVINGAFLQSTPKSLVVAAIQPGSTVALLSAFVVFANPSTAYAVILGLIVLGITVGFLTKFKTFKTEGASINSLQTFQSFLKTWVSQNPASLENYFSMYSKDEPVETRVVVAKGDRRVAIVLPGVHPGPFFPVGSYDLSELIFQELRKTGVVSMVVHGVGGHERNLPTNELAKQYASAVSKAVRETIDKQSINKIRGPNRLSFGNTTITTIGFGSQVMALLTNAPYNTDDLDPATIDGAITAARKEGVELMLIDTHNSIGGDNSPQPALSEDDWRKAFAEVKRTPEEDFQLGAAHSSDLQFMHGSDISDGGITVLVIKKRASTHALITSDSNNAIVGLRKTVADELKKQDVELVEICTSDTHKSAARYMTDRGYHALGEDTDPKALVAAISALERLAESRVSGGEVTTIDSRLSLPLIGAKSLDDFATLTKETLGFAKNYATVALATTIIICGLVLFV